MLYRFGDFILSVDDRTLRRADDYISLTPKMYDLLLVLVENPNRVLEKEFLLRSVWPDSFVEEGNITFNIRQLRVALGDDAQEPRYIETIPRRGYRFVTDVESIVEEGETDSESEPRPGTPSGGLSTRPILAVTVVLLLVAVGGTVAWYFRSNANTGAPILTAPFAVEKLSTNGQVFHAVISPDGKSIVYSRRDRSRQSLWLRQTETSNNVQIVPPSETFYGGLAIAPDGNSVYFARGSEPRLARQLEIYRMPIVGGVPQKIVEGTQGWISISPDGTKISYVRCTRANDDYCSLWIADAADGKNERRLVTTSRPIRISDNKISPDGTKIAFAVGQSWTASNDFELREVDIASAEQRPLTPEKFFNVNYIAWLPDQSGCLISARKVPDEGSRIWHIAGPAGDARQLTTDAENYNRISLNAAGSLLVATRIDPDFGLNIYRTDNPDKTKKLLADAASASFAPDGRVVYSSVMTGDQEIWISNADGSDQRQLTNDPADDIAPFASPDGKYIYFDSNRTGRIQVWRMDIDGTNATQITTDEGGFPLAISSDGQWLYYRSGLQNTVRRVSLQNGKEEFVYDPSNVEFAISPDASRIVLPRASAGERWFEIVSLANGKTERVLRSPDPTKRVLSIAWSHDSSFLAYIIEDDTHTKRSVWFQPLDGNEPRSLPNITLGEASELSGFTFSYDSKAFIIVEGKWNHDALLIKGLKL